MTDNEPLVSDTKPLRSRLKRLRERIKGVFPFASGVFATLLALILFSYLFPSRQPLTEREVNNLVVSAMASATPKPSYASQVYQIVQPSIVWIEDEVDGVDGKKSKNLGTGVVIDDSGNILTSLHVVAEAPDNISVTFADGFQSHAVILSKIPEQDIAILRTVDTPQLIVPATLGNPGSMRVGDDVYVVGNPFGFYSSMSAGVISGFDRSFTPVDSDTTLSGLIQFDAAANPGNSGGPLLNRNGYVIGIVTGIVTPADKSFFVGIGFAVPITVAAGGGGGSPPY